VPSSAKGGNDTPPGLFICYRKNDSPGQALRVYRLLSTAFGDDRVSMDVTIPPAVDFVEWIEQRVGTAGVMVPIIGRTWLEADAHGRSRIHDERDFVRNEISAALRRNIAVLPVLVDGAEMPNGDALPADLERLPRLQAHHLRSDVDWQSSESRLVQTLAGLLGEPVPGHAPQGPAQSPPERRWPGLVTTGLVGVALLVVGLVLLWHEFITPRFVSLPDGVPAGIFTAVAPLGVLAGAVIGLTLVSREATTTWLRVGLLAGFAVEAGVKGLSLLDNPSSRIQTGGLLWLAGGATLAATAGIAARHLSRQAPADSSDQPLYGPTAVVALIGAAMLVVGALIPFNIAEGTDDRIVAELGWLAADPIGTAIAVVVAVGLLLARRRSLAAGLLIAFGICSTLLWVRYIGIPVAQWSTSDKVASPQAGGFVGLAGGVLVFCAGWRLAVVREAGVPAARPLPTS
jgi:TIR domain